MVNLGIVGQVNLGQKYRLNSTKVYKIEKDLKGIPPYNALNSGWNRV